MPALSKVNRRRVTTAVVLGALFWVSLAVHPYPFSPLVKWLGIGALQWTVLRNIRTGGDKLLLAALLAHGAGDIILDIDRIRLMLPAVIHFLVGHVLYVAAFWPIAKQGRYTRWTGGITMLLAAFAGGMLALMIPGLTGVLLGVVTVYVIVITVMAALALRAPFTAPLVAIGALLYVCSDSLIGYDAFVNPIAWAKLVVWPMYFAGQTLITVGYLRDKPQPATG